MNIAVNQSLQVSCNSQTAAKNSASGMRRDTGSNWKMRVVALSLATLVFL